MLIFTNMLYFFKTGLKGTRQNRFTPRVIRAPYYGVFPTRILERRLVSKYSSMPFQTFWRNASGEYSSCKSQSCFMFRLSDWNIFAPFVRNYFSSLSSQSSLAAAVLTFTSTSSVLTLKHFFKRKAFNPLVVATISFEMFEAQVYKDLKFHIKIPQRFHYRNEKISWDQKTIKR